MATLHQQIYCRVILKQRLHLNQSLALEADLSAAGDPVSGHESIQIPSSFARELLYNIEHAIHHMALIQVAVIHAFPDVELPKHFGIAYSTVQHSGQQSVVNH